MIIEKITTSTAPAAIGTYSQAIKCCEVIYVSGQIPLVPETMEIVSGDITEQIEQAFKNLLAVISATGGTLDNIVKLTIYMTDLGSFSTVNDVMLKIFVEPYPARAVIGVNELPRGAQVEIDAIVIVDN